MKSTRKVFLHFADASVTQQQTVGLLTRKQQEHAYDALRALFVFFLQVFFTQHNQNFVASVQGSYGIQFKADV